MHETVFNYVTNNSIILRRINKTMRVKRMRSRFINNGKNTLFSRIYATIYKSIPYLKILLIVWKF